MHPKCNWCLRFQQQQQQHQEMNSVVGTLSQICNSFACFLASHSSIKMSNLATWFHLLQLKIWSDSNQASNLRREERGEMMQTLQQAGQQIDLWIGTWWAIIRLYIDSIVVKPDAFWLLSLFITWKPAAAAAAAKRSSSWSDSLCLSKANTHWEQNYNRLRQCKQKSGMQEVWSI